MYQLIFPLNYESDRTRTHASCRPCNVQWRQLRYQMHDSAHQRTARGMLNMLYSPFVILCIPYCERYKLTNSTEPSPSSEVNGCNVTQEILSIQVWGAVKWKHIIEHYISIFLQVIVTHSDKYNIWIHIECKIQQYAVCYWGEYLDRGGMKWREIGGNCIMRSFTNCTLRQT
jgi:hypothetical protein